MTQFDLFIIIGLLYRHYKKKNLSKSKIGSKILIIVLCLIPIRTIMLYNLLASNIPITYKKPNNGTTISLYKFEENAVAFSINFLPLFYPVWLPYSYGMTYIRQEYFSDFSKNRLNNLLADRNKKNCFEKKYCTRYLSSLVKNKEFDKYRKMYKSYYMKPRKNRCEEAADYIRNTSYLHNGNYKMIYDDIGEDISRIIKEDKCEWVINSYITFLIETRKKSKLTQYITDFCTTENEGKCYRKYIFTAINRQKRKGYNFLEKINKDVCKKYNGFSNYRKIKKYSPPILPLCKEYLSQ